MDSPAVNDQEFCPGCGYRYDTPSCDITALVVRDREYARIRYVPRGEWERDAFPDRRPGCGIWRGTFHHVGCEM